MGNLTTDPVAGAEAGCSGGVDCGLDSHQCHEPSPVWPGVHYI